MKLWKFISALISATLVALMFSAIQGHAAVDRQCNYTVGSTTTATGFANCTEEIADLSTKAWAFPTVTGTDTIVGTSSPAVTTLSDGQMVLFKATGSNTGPTTFQLDGTSSASLYLADGSTAAGSGDIVSGVRYILTYQASPARWILLGTPGVRGVKITGDTMTGKLTLPASTTGSAPLNIPPGSTVSAPSDGDIWTETSNIKVKFASGTATLANVSGTQTFSNKTLTAPKIADLGFIADGNGNEQIIFDTVTSAVNEVTFANAATGTNPTFTASGGDTNIGLNFVPKGSGTIQVSGVEIATISASQTLTGKTINLGSNTLTGTIAQFNTAISDADIQPLDSDLTALAGNSTAGLWVSTAVGSGAARTLTAPAAGFTITNPAGTAGNPTFVLANDLAGVEGLASNGIATRTATDTWAARTITGTANEITLTNGDGVAGNPTVSLPAALTFTGKTITGGTFSGGTFSGPAITTPGAGITYAGSTSGTTTLAASAVAGTTALTLPAATDTLVGKATTDTLTNKTISGASNTLTNIGNSSLTNSATTVNSQTCTLGSSCTVTVPVATGITGLGTGVATALATPSSANLRSAATDEVGTGPLMFGLAPTMSDDLTCTGSQVVRRNAGDTAFECATVSGTGDALVANPLSQFAATTSSQLAGVISDETGTGALVFGTAPTITGANITGVPISTGISGLGTGVATALATPSSANLRSAVTDEVGTGSLMFGLVSTMTDDLACTGSQVVRRNAGDTAFECATVSGTGDMVAANNLSDVANTATAFSNIKQAATDTATGVVELATTTEATTGTDTVRAVTPAGLAAAISASASHVNIQTFTASGTYTPTAGLDHAVVVCTGGGGGGGAGTNNPGAGNGGSGAGTAIEEYSAATIGASQTVTIGAGGAGSSSGVGSDGSDTTFGALMTATKGVGGSANANSTPTAGGIPTGGDVNITGGDGGSGATVTGWALGGIGGGTYWGPGGAPAFTTSSGVTGGNGNAYGSGGAGGATNVTGNGTGGDGKSGICVITEYY